MKPRYNLVPNTVYSKLIKLKENNLSEKEINEVKNNLELNLSRFETALVLIKENNNSNEK